MPDQPLCIASTPLHLIATLGLPSSTPPLLLLTRRPTHRLPRFTQLLPLPLLPTRLNNPRRPEEGIENHGEPQGEGVEEVEVDFVRRQVAEEPGLVDWEGGQGVSERDQREEGEGRGESTYPSACSMRRKMLRICVGAAPREGGGEGQAVDTEGAEGGTEEPTMMPMQESAMRVVRSRTSWIREVAQKCPREVRRESGER